MILSDKMRAFIVKNRAGMPSLGHLLSGSKANWDDTVRSNYTVVETPSPQPSCAVAARSAESFCFAIGSPAGSLT